MGWLDSLYRFNQGNENDLSSQLKKCIMFKFITDFLGNILSAIGWKKIIDEKEDNKDNEKH